VATKKRSRPFYEVFLERVIRIDAVQRHRAAVTDENTAQFFSEGCRPGVYGDFRWSLDAPKAFPRHEHFSLPMQHAWDAAVAEWKGFIAELVNGELIGSGVHPATGVRHDLDPAEWTRTDRILDVRNGDLHEVHDLIEERPGKQTVRWTSITLRAVKQTRQKKERGHGYDWEGAWAYALTLRAEDQWDWEQVGRDKNQPLPARHRTVEEKIEEWFKTRGNVPVIGDIRQNITIPLYRGRRRRGKRKR
jgi:hypothetical protein